MALIIVPLVSSALVVGRYLYAKVFDLEPWPEDDAESHPVEPIAGGGA
jgi:hypothetical protein